MGATSYAPSRYAGTITVRNGHSVTITTVATMDEMLVEAGATLTFAGGTQTIHDGPGTDLQVNGTLVESNPTNTAWSGAATWALGPNATYVKTVGTNATNWRDNYAGGMATIPPTATWVLRKTGTANPVLTTVASTYPNLIIENFHTAAWNTAAGSTFQGGASPVVLGDLDVGGSGTNTVSFISQVTGTVRVHGSTIVRVGSTLSVNNTGTFEALGDMLVNGSLTYSGTSRVSFAGGGTQAVDGTGNFSAYNLTVNKPSGDVQLGMPITVNNVLDLTAGRILNHGTPHLVTLATTATVVNASNASFVTGKVRKRGNAAFTFPVGKGGHLRPVGMSAVPPAGGAVAPVVETFTRSAGDCAMGCPAHNYTTDVGTWTVTATGANGPASNNWYISYSHSGPLNVCPIQPGTNPTLHIGPRAGGVCLLEDCGAVYNDGPSNITDLRVGSPFLDFSGITVTGISYRVTHQGFTVNDPNDRASLWGFDGTNWLYVFDLMGGAECATYSGGSPVITNALSNNPAGRIGIRWQNNGNGLRNSRS